ncbi:MAG TPA: hypothetical protein VFA30_10320 [Gaiellaceae bacterium]|nr:hypothetical protein [Gaiellaceae bacterium]
MGDQLQLTGVERAELLRERRRNFLEYLEHQAAPQQRAIVARSLGGSILGRLETMSSSAGVLGAEFGEFAFSALQSRPVGGFQALRSTAREYKP